jgi:hypothetical protein
METRWDVGEDRIEEMLRRCADAGCCPVDGD